MNRAKVARVLRGTSIVLGTLAVGCIAVALARATYEVVSEEATYRSNLLMPWGLYQ